MAQMKTRKPITVAPGALRNSSEQLRSVPNSSDQLRKGELAEVVKAQHR